MGLVNLFDSPMHLTQVVFAVIHLPVQSHHLRQCCQGEFETSRFHGFQHPVAFKHIPKSNVPVQLTVILIFGQFGPISLF